MPKSTFYNLSEDKKQKIEKAIKEEFSKHSASKVSISNIIEKAGIPRGSFYQYFEDKDDALKYIINKFIEVENEEIRKLLIKNEGNIFQTSLDIYEYILEKNSAQKERNLCKNIIEELKNENTNMFEKFNAKDKFKIREENLINIENIRLENEDDLKYILKILSTVIRTEIINVMREKKTKGEARKDLLKQIEILKRGMEKQ